MVLSHVKRYDLNEINNAFINIERKKSKRNRDIFEGGNEYDDITRSYNFNIKEIPEYTINPYELIFLKNIIEDAIKNIKIKSNVTSIILPNMEECLNIINEKLRELDDLSDIISDKELEKFFRKLIIIELNALQEIFEYVQEYNIERIINIEKKVINEKKLESKIYLKPVDFSILNILNKISNFNDTELSFLSNILDDAMIGLFDYIDENTKQNDEKFTKLNYLFSNIQEAVEEEIINRKKEKKIIKIK